QPAFQRRRQLRGVAVGGDHDLACLDRPLAGEDAEAAGLAFDLLGIAVGAELGAGAVRGLQQAAVVERRMELAGALDHHPAVVIVGRDLLALLFARHHVGAEAGAGIVGPDFGLLLRVVAWRVGAGEAPVHAPVALDALALDHGLDLGQRIGRIGQHALHDLLPRLGVSADAPAAEALAHGGAAPPPAPLSGSGTR